MSEIDATWPFQSEEARHPRTEQVPDVVESLLQPCCESTIRLHSAHNPMMVCPICKQFIKCFKDEKSCRNYLKFCKSRHRKVTITRFENTQIVMYHTYGNVQGKG